MAASLDLAKVASKSLLDLPDELLYKIFEHAGSKAIISLSLTCLCCQLMELERQIHNEENNGPFPRTSYFFDIVKHIPRLQSLNLTRCRWLNSHSLLALSKITCLRELVLNDCYRIGNNIAYTPE
ncbi:hypothetical protein B566_EDAN014330 [Ephemera danica]|nr:hypothetical protein B566_EDAN014330 [Ephemera danica]